MCPLSLSCVLAGRRGESRLELLVRVVARACAPLLVGDCSSSCGRRVDSWGVVVFYWHCDPTIQSTTIHYCRRVALSSSHCLEAVVVSCHACSYRLKMRVDIEWGERLLFCSEGTSCWSCPPPFFNYCRRPVWRICSEQNTNSTQRSVALATCTRGDRRKPHTQQATSSLLV